MRGDGYSDRDSARMIKAKARDHDSTEYSAYKRQSFAIWPSGGSRNEPF